MPERIINVHTHLHHSQNVAERIKLWRACNVVKVCILCLYPYVQNKPMEDYYTNEDLRPLLQKHGDILVGMGALNLGRAPEGPEAVDRLKAWGFAGLKIIQSYYPYNHELYFPLYARAEQLGMPVFFHTGWLASGADDGELGINADHYRPYMLDKVARAFPKLKIIGAHLGKPHAEEALQMLIYPHVYYDLSGGSGRKPHELWITRALSPYLPGADMRDPAENPALEHFKKFCFATDNPEPPIWIEVSERIMDRLCIPAETRERFYWRNAASIFGWKESDL